MSEMKNVNVINCKSKIYEEEKKNMNETKQKPIDTINDNINNNNYIYIKKNNNIIENNSNKRNNNLDLNLNNIGNNKFKTQTELNTEDDKYIKNNLLQEQINSLNDKNNIMKNKLVIFLKLMRQYSHKLTALINNNDNNNNNINTNEADIINTLSRLNKMLNDPKLNKDVFEITQILLDDSTKDNIENENIEIKNEEKEKEKEKENNKNEMNTIHHQNDSNIILTEINESNDEENNKNILDNSNIDNDNKNKNNEIENNEKNKNNSKGNEYDKDLEGLICKYEEKINILINENNILKENKENQEIIHDNLLNENISLEKEINKLKEKLNEEIEKNEELNSKYNYLSQTLIDLENKNNFLEKENLFLKNSLNENCYKFSNINRTNSKNLNQKIKMMKNIEKIIKENNDNSDNDKENNDIIKAKLNKSETQFYPNNILNYKDLGGDCNFFRKRNIGNAVSLRTEPNKIKSIQNLKRVSSNKYLTNYNESFGNIFGEVKINNKRNNLNDGKNNNFQKNYSCNMIIPSNYNKQMNLKKEIDDLDEEILEIQYKINEMLHN